MPFSALSLLETLKVGEGDWLIQTAANGAVGKIMVGLAKARGVNLLNLVRREGAAEEMRDTAPNMSSPPKMRIGKAKRVS